MAELSPTELKLLRWMSAHPGEVVSRERLLQEVWGYAEAVVSRTVDTTMRRLRKKLERDRAQPEHLHTVRGEGYRFTPLLSPSVPGAGVALAPTPAPAPARVRLPAPLTGFVGRVEGLSRLDVLLSRRRLVTVLGPGGVGKTRLALEAARRQQHVFSDILLCELSAVTDLEGVTATLNAALGLPRLAGAAAARHALQDRARPLVIFDNAEHVIDALTSLLAGLLVHVAPLVALVTSRQRLQLRGEAVLPLVPLTTADAVELLTERAIDAGAPPVAGDSVLLVELVERLDRLPLAIELAAARLDVLSVQQLLDQLTDRFALLSADWVGVEARQATMWGAINWSWSRLSAAEQAALARFALVRGSVSAEGFAALVGAAPLPDSADVLRRLVGKSLVHRDGDWFRLLDSVRDFVGAHLPEQRDAVAVGWARWLVEAATGHRSRIDGVAPQASMSWLARVRTDLLAIWERHHSDESALAARALLLLHPMLDAAALLEASRARYAVAITLDIPDALRGALLIALAEVSGWRSDGAALTHASAALKIADAIGDPALQVRARCEVSSLTTDPARRLALSEAALTQARPLGGQMLLDALLERANVALHTRNPALARALLEEGVAQCVAEGAELFEAILRRMLGLVLGRQGHMAEGVACLQRAASIYASHGKIGAEGWALNHLGILYLERSQHGPAERYFRQALQRLRYAGSIGVSSVLTNLAAVHHQEKNLDRARALYQEALVEITQAGRRFETALTHTNLGGVELEALNLDASERHLTEALSVAESLASVWLRAFASAYLGALWVYRGQYAAAASAISSGVSLSREGGFPRMESFNLAQQGALLLAEGDPAGALSVLDVALAKIDEQGDATVRGIVLVRRGATLLALGETSRGRRDLGVARADPSLQDAVAIWLGEDVTPVYFEGHLAARLSRSVSSA